MDDETLNVLRSALGATYKILADYPGYSIQRYIKGRKYMTRGQFIPVASVQFAKLNGEETTVIKVSYIFRAYYAEIEQKLQGLNIRVIQEGVEK